MPDLATIIAQQAELVSRQQLTLTRSLRAGDGEGPPPIKGLIVDGFNDLSKSATSMIDKYATLLMVQRDAGPPPPPPPPLRL